MIHTSITSSVNNKSLPLTPISIESKPALWQKIKDAVSPSGKGLNAQNQMDEPAGADHIKNVNEKSRSAALRDYNKAFKQTSKTIKKCNQYHSKHSYILGHAGIEAIQTPKQLKQGCTVERLRNATADLLTLQTHASIAYDRMKAVPKI